MKKVLAFILLLVIHLHADLRQDSYYNNALASQEPSCIIDNCVSAISGDYFLFHKNLNVIGADPIIFKSTYNSRHAGTFYAGHYAYLPNQVVDHIIAEKLLFVPVGNGTNIAFQLTESNLKAIYEKRQTINIYLDLADPNTLPGCSNAFNYNLDATSYIKNTKVEVGCRDGFIKTIKVIDPNGTIRYYDIGKIFTKTITDKLPKYLRTKDQKYFSVDIPFRTSYKLIKEIKPNGNIVIYEYSNNNDNLTIYTKNPTQTKNYSWLNCISKNKQHFTFTTSNNKAMTRTFSKIPTAAGDGHDIYFLNNLSSSDMPEEKYQYLLTDQTRGIKKYPLINRTLPDDRQTSIEYSFKNKQPIVSKISLPVGNDSSLQTTHTFNYCPAQIGVKGGYNEVFDSQGNKTLYSFSKYLRIDEIARHKGSDELLNKEKFVWGAENTKEVGLLLKKLFLNNNNKIIFSKTYQYDNRGNAIKDTISGNISGIASDKAETYSTYKRYTLKDHKNLLIEQRSDDGISYHYTYFKNTNLVSSKITKYHDEIKLREFYQYDYNDHILLKEIVDDGSTLDINNLQGVTQRKIKCITPKSTYPFIDMPEVVEDKYLDLTTLEEKLILKKVLHYSDKGYVIQEDIYDSLNIFAYCINREFDDAGNLLSETNPIGQKAAYSYDNNFNKLKEIPFDNNLKLTYEYDYSNRPITLTKEALKPHDQGSEQTNTFTYDYNSNKTSSIDYLNNKSEFHYDFATNDIVQKQAPPILSDEQNLINPKLKYEYDSMSRIVKEIDGNDNEKTISYNIYNKPTLIQYPDNSSERFVYNLDGTLNHHIDQLGIKTSYEYDFLKREIKKTKYSKTDEVILIEEKTYSSFNLLSLKDAEGNVTNYTYDFSGKLISKTTNDEVTNYYYDNLSRLVKTEISNSENTLITEEKKDLLGRIIETKKTDLNGNIYFLENYEYDTAGNKTKILNCLNIEAENQIDNIQANRIQEFEYDSFNRLIKSVNSLGGITTVEYKISYDKNLNQKILKKILTDPVGLKTIEKINSFEKVLKITKKKMANSPKRKCFMTPILT